MALREELHVRKLSKSRRCQKGGEGGLTHAKIFLVDLTQCKEYSPLGSPQSDDSTQKSEHLSPKMDHHPQLVNIYPKMIIYTLLSSKCCESHLRAFVVKSTRAPGLG